MSVSAEAHVFIGMFRPPHEEISKHLVCPKCGRRANWVGGSMVGHYEDLTNCWLAGHFDTPQYATRDEIIDRIAEKATTP